MGVQDEQPGGSVRGRGHAGDEASSLAAVEIDPIEEGVVGPAEAGHGPLPRAKGLGLTADNRFRTGRLAGLGMHGAMWALSWPVMVESFLNSLVGLSDTWMSSQLGVEEADAIGGASYIMWFIGLTFMAVGVGATALISRAMGMGRRAVADATLAQSLSVAVVSGAAVGAAVFAAAGPVASLLSLSDAATAAFVSYLRIIAAGVPFGSVLFVLTACARGAGDAQRPLVAMVVRNAVNIAASFVLSGVDIAYTSTDGAGVATSVVLVRNPFGFDMGIAGIAWGTVLGDVAAAAVVLWMAWSGTWGIRLRRRRLLPHRATLARLVRLAVPNYFETLGMWVGNFVTVLMVGWMGAGLLGSHIIAIRLESLSFLPGFAVGTAAATLAGQYLGAGRADLAREAIWKCAALAASLMACFGVAFMVIPGVLVGAMSAQAVHLEHTPTPLFIAGLVQVPFAVGIVLRGAMRGAGDVRFVMAITWASTYAVRLPLAFLLSGVDIVREAEVGGEVVRTVLVHNPMPDDFALRGLTGLWAGLCIDVAIRCLVYGARFMHGGWARQRV